VTPKTSYDVAFYLPWMTPLVAADTGQPWPGGAETQVLLLARALAEQGLSVCLIVFDVPGADIPASVDGVDVIVRPPYTAGGNLLGQIREVFRLRKAVRGVDAGVVVTRCAGYHVGLSGIWTKLARRQFVYSSSGLRDFKYEISLTKWRDRVLFHLGIKLADKIVVQTEEQAVLCERRFARKGILIRSLCEPAERSTREPEAFLWVGRVDDNKRPLEFLELARAVPDARFRMVATPAPSAAGSEQLWDAIELADRTLPNFELLPPCPRPELLELIARAVAVVSTSEYEGMPNIFLEGWARGVPALALHYDPDGIITRHGLGGFAGGRRERLIELTRELWETRLARDELAAECRAYVIAHHSPQTVGATWVGALQLATGGLAEPIPVGGD
jgi:glycosyltransferase involved in cell wall biosynthesis